jgi:hypothetical protein
VQTKPCTLKREKVWHLCPEPHAVAQIQCYAIQNSACLPDVTATALSSTITGSVLRKVPRYPIFRIPRYRFVLLLHVNWLQLRFTYTRGYNDAFLTSLQFTEILTVAIFLETVYWDLVCFCVTRCSCNTMLWRRTDNLKYAPVYFGLTDQLHGAESSLRNWPLHSRNSEHFMEHAVAYCPS